MQALAIRLADFPDGPSVLLREVGLKRRRQGLARGWSHAIFCINDLARVEATNVTRTEWGVSIDGKLSIVGFGGA